MIKKLLWHDTGAPEFYKNCYFREDYIDGEWVPKTTFTYRKNPDITAEDFCHSCSKPCIVISDAGSYHIAIYAKFKVGHFNDDFYDVHEGWYEVGHDVNDEYYFNESERIDVKNWAELYKDELKQVKPDKEKVKPDREKINARYRAWAHANPDKIREKNKRYYERSKERKNNA